LGWEWSQDMIEVADSLYYQQIPKQWCYLSGSASEFTHYPLASFINDLTTRFQHIDKCLTLVSLLLALMVRWVTPFSIALKRVEKECRRTI
jgi:hypothetical protein